MTDPNAERKDPTLPDGRPLPVAKFPPDFGAAIPAGQTLDVYDDGLSTGVVPPNHAPSVRAVSLVESVEIVTAEMSAIHDAIELLIKKLAPITSPSPPSPATTSSLDFSSSELCLKVGELYHRVKAAQDKLSELEVSIDL